MRASSEDPAQDQVAQARWGPLELPGWLEFNAWRTRLEPYRFSSGNGDQVNGLNAVLYLDRRGRVRLPGNNPYLPVSFNAAPEKRSSDTALWHRVAAPLVEEMRKRTSANQLYLSPEVQDVRPWVWRNFLVGVRYTYFLELPFVAADADRLVRRMTDRATKAGMSVTRVTDPAPVIECLADTEQRQGFSHHLGARELGAARDLLGDEHLRMYVCYDSAARPASSLIMLHAPGTRAIAWVGGTKSTALRDGASHLVWRASFDDLHGAGAIGVDMCGANMESVAGFKAHWGPRLVTNFAVRTYGLRTAGRFAASWRAARRR